MTQPEELVIHRRGALVFLRKPAGLPVFPPHADPEGDCLLSRWLECEPGLASVDWPEGFSGGLAHRLDTPTSGIVMACTSLEALDTLRGEFAGGRLVKRYRFVTLKRVPWDRHRIDAPIAHDRRRRARMVVQRGGRTPHRGRWYPAETTLERQGARLWSAVIHSGVTHQIRVHAAFAGLALAGDRLYGGGPLPEGLAPPPGADFLLHHEAVEAPSWRSPLEPVPAWWGPYSGSGS
jgi:23S rRNA pseudouridine1911/1915/1917 synthase